jgi:formylglycine-generating enzyme required for sulfatase activity
MVQIPSGEYRVGSDASYPEERPARMAAVGEFWIDETEVTNAQFGEFVRATGYVTLAEKQPTKDQYPGALPALLKPGSAVFVPGKSKVPAECWIYKPGVSWRGGDPGKPVVHVAYEDALAYAKWAEKDLPTEEEWEAAAGADGAIYTWGNEEKPKGKWPANVWQGDFPKKDTGDDGFAGLAPVKSFPPNRFGLYDMAGNVWEWTKSDGPHGTKITKGGSFLCAREYCHRYRPSAKQPVTPDTSTEHIGFRCVWRN